MNWFTREYIGGLTNEQKQELADQDGACEHVEADISLAVFANAENDSFGKVGTFVCCQACQDKAKKEEEEREVTCNDCKASKPAKDTIAWRWYDFYTAQGDEPIIVCTSCQQLPRHISRVNKDEADRRWEMGITDGDYDDGDDE